LNQEVNPKFNPKFWYALALVEFVISKVSHLSFVVYDLGRVTA